MAGVIFWRDTMGGLAGGAWTRKKKDKAKLQESGETKSEEIPIEKYSGYFTDKKLEEDFVRETQGKKRAWLLLSAAVLLCLHVVDLGFSTVMSTSDSLSLVRKTVAMACDIFLGGISLWYPFAPCLFEKLVAGGIVLWVFAVCILRQELLIPLGSPEELYLLEAQVVATVAMFAITMFFAMPVRRPTLVSVIGTVCFFQVATGVALVTISSFDTMTTITGLYQMLVAAVVFVILCLHLAREEHAARVVFFQTALQKAEIADLLDEVDGLIRVKSTVAVQAGSSSAERLVGLVTSAVDELRWQEKILRQQACGGDPVTAGRLADTTRQVIKGLMEAATLASHAENLMQVDIGKIVRFGQPEGLSEANPAMQGVGAIPLIQRESSPFSSSPMDLKQQGQMVSFLNTNFVRQRIQHRLPSAASRRRSSVFLLREDGTCPTTPTSSKQKLHEEVDRLLQPFEEVLPTSLGRKAESTEDLNRSFQSDQGGEGGRKPAENPAREWNLDVKELEDKENSISPPFTPSPSNSAVMRIRNALPIIGLQLLRPYLHSPLGMKDLSKTFQFLQLVEANYSTKAKYHNAIHGAEVAQMTVWLTEHSGVRRLLSKIQNVSVVIAALCHDLAHEGFNNQFHLSSGSEIAMMYNDRSVLENFHAAKAFLILKTTGCELLENLGGEDPRLARAAIIDLILDTDIKNHFEFGSALKLRISAPGFASSMTPSESSVLLGKVTGEENEKDGEKEKEQQDSADGIWMVTRACLKAADLGHSAKPWHIHFARSLCVTLEFFHQGDTERALGLPISPLCNRRETTPAGLCKSQVGFLNFVCRDLFVSLAQVEHISKGRGRRPSECFSTARLTLLQSDNTKERDGGTPLHSNRMPLERSMTLGLGKVASVCLSNLDANVERWKRTETVGLLPPSLFSEPESQKGKETTTPGSPLPSSPARSPILRARSPGLSSRRILKLNSAASCVSLNETLTQLKPHQPKRSSSQKVTLLVPPQEDTQQQQQQQILQREASPSSSIKRRVEGLLKEVERVELEGLARDGLVEIPSLGPGG